jgi:RNA polymerase sigma-70 factor (ECF subfamily)
LPAHPPETPTDGAADQPLVARLRAGDSDAFATVFRAHYGALVRLAEAMLGGRAPAEDVVQDVMLELWRRRDAMTVHASLRAYLFRAVRNRALNQLRHRRIARRVNPEAVAPAPPPRPDGAVVEAELDAAIRAAVAGLPDRCREVFELSRIHGLRYAEIAATLEISVKTVEAQMGKAIRVLRGRLADWLPGGQEGA